jgi:hypothetical protein
MDHRSFFTLILDWRGGTFVSQVWAKSPHDAVLVWVERDLFRPAADLDRSERNQLQRDLESKDRAPTPLVDTDGVWCATASLRGDLACIHIVKTTASDDRTDSI